MTDDHRVPVAKVWRAGHTNTLCDLQGGSVLRTFVEFKFNRTTGRQPSLFVVDGVGAEMCGVSWMQAMAVTLWCRVGDEEKTLTVKVKRTPGSGALKGVELLDRTKRQVGAITLLEQEGNVLKQGTCWLHLERDPDLVEPVRSLAIAAPLMVSSFLFHV